MDIAIFGLGFRANRLVRLLETYKKEVSIEFFLDNYKTDIHKGYETKQATRSNCLNHKIVVSPGGDAFKSIKKQLEAYGMTEGTDFWSYENFIFDVLQKIRRENKPFVRVSFLDFWDGFKDSYNEIFWRERLLDAFDYVIDDLHPQMVISSVFGQEAIKKKECIHVLFSGENTRPDYENYEYNIGFCCGEDKERYLRWPLYYMYEGHWLRAIKKHENVSMDSFLNRGFCSRVVSNGSFETREEIFLKLDSKSSGVASGGRSGNNIGYLVEDKNDFISKYRFNLAIENSVSDGYVTEKILQAFSAGCIPIYYGSPTIYDDFNKGSFVNIADFSSIDDAVDYIITLDKDEDELCKYLKTPILHGGNTGEERYCELENFLEKCAHEASNCL